jgi:hypothetical protein
MILAIIQNHQFETQDFAANGQPPTVELGQWPIRHHTSATFVNIMLLDCKSAVLRHIFSSVESNYQKQLWTELSDQARAVAKTIRDPDRKLHMLLMAARYLVLARQSGKAGRPLQGRKKPTE